MSFFFSEAESNNIKKGQGQAEFLHQMECKACPLNKAPNHSPKIKPHGAKNPLIYILNDFPTYEDDSNGEFLSGPEGNLLYSLIPKQYESQIRHNSIVRSRPMKEDIAFTEIECCRPSIVKDIIESRPKVIIGLGDKVLSWLVGSAAIYFWRGRKAIISLEGHVFHFYPVFHPTYILKKLEEKKYGTEEYAHINEIDFKNIFAEIDDLPEPEALDLSTLYDGVKCYEGGEKDLEDIISFFAEQQYRGAEIGFDIETNGFRPYRKDAKILSMSFSVAGGETISFAVDHPKAKWNKEQRKILDEVLQEFFSDRTNTIIAHNLGFEMEWIAYFYGKHILRKGKWGDTQAQAYVIDNRYGGEQLKLDTLCLRYFGFNLKEQSDIDVGNLIREPLHKVLKYNALDAKYTGILFYELRYDLEKKNLISVYNDQVSYTPTLVLTQMLGVDVDQDFVRTTQKALEKSMEKIEIDISQNTETVTFTRMTGEKFNPSSPVHLSTMFGDILRIPSVKKTKGGRASFDEDVLKGIDHPIAKQILELKSLSKVKGTYIDNLNSDAPDTDVYPDGKVHTSLSTMFTNTNRVSSSGPNMQNQPRKKNKELVRPAFTAPKGHSFVAFDYGQLEARVIAMYSKDAKFVKALWENLDVHQDWALRISKRYPQALDQDGGEMKKLRDRVKNKWVFPLFFGAGKKTVAGYMNIPVDVALPLFDVFWREFKGVHTWQKEVGKFYEEHGYVEFLNGRRRVGPLPWSEQINSPIQGLAANLVMDSYCRLSLKAQQEDKPWLQPILQIHDDLSFVIPDKYLEEALDDVITEMVTFKQPFVNVPMNVEGSLGTNWYNKEDFGTFASNTWKK